MDWLKSIGWLLQFVALIVVGFALLVGLVQNALRAEVGLLALGSAIFLIGRWLQSR